MIYCRNEGININNNDERDLRGDVTLNNSILYNAMIYPFTRMVNKGIIWYQGNQHLFE